MSLASLQLISDGIKAMESDDATMYAKGYRYRLTPKDKSFAPLYAKTIKNCVMVKTELYPDKKFFVKCISPKSKINA